MAARSKARKRAVDLLYESDVRGIAPLDTLLGWQARNDPPVAEHTALVVDTYVRHAAVVDQAIGGRLIDWDYERVAPVDRAILRTAATELLFLDDVPDPVAIDEAVELAKRLSSDDSPAFVNGVLGRLAADKADLVGGNSVADGGDGAASVGIEHAPDDQSLGELAGTLVIDDGE